MKYPITLLMYEMRIARSLFYQRIYAGRKAERDLVEQFNGLYYNSFFSGGTWKRTHWLGTRILKCPMDLWVYQEILWELRPDVVIETGTAHGGSALFLASMLDLLGAGRVITIDIEEKAGRPVHPRIQYLCGSSVSSEIHERVKASIRPGEKVMLILDSDHSKEHVLLELELLGPLVTVGSYLIVEDTNLNGHPIEPLHGPGPAEAVAAFLEADRRFAVDRERERFHLTFNPGGYLRRLA